jgi:MtN3 and saliva related transmembrane protein
LQYGGIEKLRNFVALKIGIMDFVSVIGFSAATLTTVAFIPQAVKTIKTKQTKDISFWMYSILIIGVLLWLTYGIYNHDWPIILANSITFVLVLPILVLKIIHK